MMPELNQYGEADAGASSFWGGTKDFLDFGMDAWKKVETVNAIKDSSPRHQNQLAEVDQQVQPVVHQAPVIAAPTMIGGFPQKTVIAGLVAVVILGLIVRGNS